MFEFFYSRRKDSVYFITPGSLTNQYNAIEKAIRCSLQKIYLLCPDYSVPFILGNDKSIYPPGCLIGHVTKVEFDRNLYQRATVQPKVDPYSLDEVLLVLRRETAAAELSGHEPEEDPPPAKDVEPGSLPDTRSDAERLAP